MVHFAYDVRDYSGGTIYGIVVFENCIDIWEADHTTENIIFDYDPAGETGDCGAFVWDSKLIQFRWFDVCFDFDESIRDVLRGWKEVFLTRK